MRCARARMSARDSGADCRQPAPRSISATRATARLCDNRALGGSHGALELLGVLLGQAEVTGLRVVEHEGRHGALGLHHESLRELHPDRSLDVEKPEKLDLVFE